jgi:hypothetical protein
MPYDNRGSNEAVRPIVAIGPVVPIDGTGKSVRASAKVSTVFTENTSLLSFSKDFVLTKLAVMDAELNATPIKTNGHTHPE